jgi:hypothetical protein
MVFSSEILQDAQHIRMHDGITVAAAQKYLPQTLAEIDIKPLVYDVAIKMLQGHVRVDTRSVVVARTLRTSSVAVTGYFQLIF